MAQSDFRRGTCYLTRPLKAVITRFAFSVITDMYLFLLGLALLFYLFRWIRELPRVSDKGNKYVYVTGCDSGFGNLLARHLDKKGFRVIAGCFTEKGEEDLRKSCSSNLITTHLDVTSKDSTAKVAAMIKEKVGERGETVFCCFRPPYLK